MTWKECRSCRCPIGDTDELCRELTCELYGKRAVNERSVSTKADLITCYSASGVLVDDPSIWDRLIQRFSQPEDMLGPILLDDLR